jgi:hypothetical protein
MKMNELQVGKVYRRVRVSKNGVRMTGQNVMVDATYVAQQFSKRQDRVQVHNVVQAEGGSWNYTGSHDKDGNPWRYLLLARELMTLEEVEALNEKARLDEEERQRKRYERSVVEDVAERMIAARLGISVDAVNVSFGTDELGQPQPYRATLSGNAIEEILRYDDDADRIEEALMDAYSVPANQQITATPYELARAIVQSMRNGHGHGEGK